MRLRRFLISEPMAARNGSRSTGSARHILRSRTGGGAAGRVDARTFGGGVTAARGPLESQVEVRNLAPEPRPGNIIKRLRATPSTEETVHLPYRPLSAVVLAAGEGTRMRSATPKVLHPLCGRPMLLHVLDTLVELPLERIVVVVGHGAERVTKTLQEQLATEIPVEFVEQRVQRGTGDAASVGAHRLRRRARRRRRRDRAHRRHPAAAGRHAGRRSRRSTGSPTPPRRCSPPSSTTPRATGGSCATPAATSSGSSSRPTPTVPSSRSREVNPSIYCFRRAFLAPALRRLSPENAQGEYYLTDVVGVLRQAGHAVLGDPGRRPDRDAGRQRPRAARGRRGHPAPARSTTVGCARASR